MRFLILLGTSDIETAFTAVNSAALSVAKGSSLTRSESAETFENEVRLKIHRKDQQPR